MSETTSQQPNPPAPNPPVHRPGGIWGTARYCLRCGIRERGAGRVEYRSPVAGGRMTAAKRTATPLAPAAQ